MAKRPRVAVRLLGALLPANPLARDLAVILLIKVAAIAVIWWVFFSGSGGEPGAAGMADQLLSGSLPSPHNRS